MKVIKYIFPFNNVSFKTEMNFQSFRTEIYKIEDREFPDKQIFGKKNNKLTYVIRQIGRVFILNRKVNYMIFMYPLPILKFNTTTRDNSVINLMMIPGFTEILLLIGLVIGFFWIDPFIWFLFLFLPAYVIYILIFNYLSNTLRAEIELLLKENGFITE